MGDLGVHYGAQIPVVACSEVVPERARMLRALYPQATIHEGDLWVEKDALVAGVRERLRNRRPFLLVMSPPCQGMSSNGAGRISAAVAKGIRPEEDVRNRLVLPALDVAVQLDPDVVILENVKYMQRTTITNELGETENAIDAVRRRLAAYRIEAKVIDASWYGVPQKRERLILIATRDARDANAPLHCPPTHERTPVTLRAAIGHLPALDACTRLADPRDSFHCVPRWTAHQHYCMRHTPEGETAFDNLECVECGVRNGAEAALCAACGARLARPSIEVATTTCLDCRRRLGRREQTCKACGPDAPTRTEAQVRLVRAFRTAYRRMRGDRPSSTLTTNSGVISSDVKGHPSEHRVLSVREVLIVASLASHPSFCAPWDAVAARVFAEFRHRTVREVAGESIPPLVLYRLCEHLLATRKGPLAPLEQRVGAT